MQITFHATKNLNKPLTHSSTLSQQLCALVLILIGIPAGRTRATYVPFKIDTVGKGGISSNIIDMASTPDITIILAQKQPSEILCTLRNNPKGLLLPIVMAYLRIL